MQIYDSLAGANLPHGSACVALGLFDGLHLGHRAVLQATLANAARQGLAPVCFTFTTRRSAPAAKTGMTRLMSDEMTAALLEEMGFAAVVRPDFDEFRGLSPRAFVREVVAERLGAGAVVCGFDFHFGRGAAGTPQELVTYCRERKIAAAVVPALVQAGEPVSSSRIRALVSQGDMPGAGQLLGRPFAIDFEVVPGRKLGRTLGFPTINQPLPPGFTQPRFGVYATLAHLEDGVWGSVTSVGVKPTVGSDYALAETYIPGIDRDLYGKRVRVDFLRFLRPEEKYASLEELCRQMALDTRAAEKITRAHLAANR